MLLPPLAVLTLLVLLPALGALRFSLGLVPEDNVSYASGLNVVRSAHPTLEPSGRLFASASFRRDLGLTLAVTLLSVTLLTLVSYALAVYARFGRDRWVGVVRTLYLLPMFIPGIIAAYAITTFYGDHGLLQAMLGRVGVGYTSPIRQSWGIVLGSVWTGIPFAVLMLSSGLDAVAEEQVEAARDAGASPLWVFFAVTLPISMPGIIMALILTFLGSLDESQATLIIGTPQITTLPIQMYTLVSSYPEPVGAVFSVLLATPSVVLLLLARRYLLAGYLAAGFKGG